MPTKTADTRDTRAGLSRERVVRAAIRLADRRGMKALSMRRLAAELGVEAMSLYHYVSSKDELLGEMLDLVFSEIEVPLDGDWRSAVRTMAVSTHDTLLRHPWAASLTTSSPRVIGPRLRHMDTVLRRLREAGFTDTLTDHAYHALDSYVIGFTLWQLPIMEMSHHLPDLARQFYEQLPVDEFPHLAAHIKYHMAPPRDEISAFEFGLDLILDGLERLRDAQ
ncbi:MAG: TetR/AcrR family transcriptional regulator [Chloroflexota bacterium]|nr:TetR/AcrR family transcriptional regulator [Chloroflexota bacterium]